MTTSIFKIKERSIIKGGWGDYAYILQHGMACHSARTGGLLGLERTGPYIPPITFPGIGEIVLTSPARELLESSGLTGFGFQPVIKVLTVELGWEKWDLNAEEPAFYPDSGEPEDYILEQFNNQAAADALGELWELVVPDTAMILRSKQPLAVDESLSLKLSTWDGSDIFKASDCGYIFFSLSARDLFSQHWDKYVQFQEFPTA